MGAVDVDEMMRCSPPGEVTDLTEAFVLSWRPYALRVTKVYPLRSPYLMGPNRIEPDN